MATDSSFEQLLNINQELFAQGDYESACHTLMAAMDRARYLKHPQMLQTVGHLADEQLATLNALVLPARFAAERGLRKQSLYSLYRSMIQQCVSWEQLVIHWHEHAVHNHAAAHEEEAGPEAPSRPVEG